MLRDFFKRLRGDEDLPAVPPPPPPPMDIPLFPLGTVLFPGGSQPLRIFEQRYLDMASACLKDGAPFGICLIAAGSEVRQPGGAVARPHPVGTLARIVEWDMAQLGILEVVVRGEQRFRIQSHVAGEDGLLRGTVIPLADDAPTPVPERFADILPLLGQIMSESGARFPEPHRLDDAGWVANRFAEVLPVQPLAKQKLMELEDPLSRLEIIHRYLAQRGLASD